MAPGDQEAWPLAPDEKDLPTLERGKSPPESSLPGFVPRATQDWLLYEGGSSLQLFLLPYGSRQPMRGVEAPTSFMRYRERRRCFFSPA